MSNCGCVGEGDFDRRVDDYNKEESIFELPCQVCGEPVCDCEEEDESLTKRRKLEDSLNEGEESSFELGEQQDEKNCIEEDEEFSEEGVCCYCGARCNPCSQACGPCIRNGPMMRFYFETMEQNKNIEN